MAAKKCLTVIKKSFIGSVILAWALIAGNMSARADAAPEPPPDGENIQPGVEITMVQMVAEEVIIDVGATFETINMGEEYAFMTLAGYRLAYNCTFWMVNQGTETESMMVRFPIRSKYDIGKLEITSIKVDGEPVEWQEDELNWNQEYDWAHFPVTFPPGEEVEIKVVYTTLTYANGYYHDIPHDSLVYILATGAGWHGPIGKGRIIIRLPYKATEENVFLENQEKPFQFNDSDLYWEFTDLEPTSEDNIWLDFVSPNRWFEILAEREKLEGSPNNVSALHRLAAAIYDVTVYEAVYDLMAKESLFNQGLEAIQKAARLAPNDLEIQMLYLGYLITSASEDNLAPLEDQIAYIQSLDAELSQEDEFALSAAEQKLGYLKTPKTNTPQPTSAPESTSTSTPSPTNPPIPPADTPQPTAPPDPTEISPDPPDGSSFPRWVLIAAIVGFGILVVIALIVLLNSRRR